MTDSMDYQGSGGAIFAWIFSGLIAWSALAACLITLN